MGKIKTLFFVTVILGFFVGCSIKNRIEPGKGIEKLTLGMDYGQIMMLLADRGHERRLSVDAQEESDNLPEALGALSSINYVPKVNPTAYPLKQLYLKEGKVIFITFSGELYPQTEAGLSDCPLNGSLASCLDALGQPELAQKDAYARQQAYYFNRGVSVVGRGDKVVEINVFNPLNSDQQQKFIAAVKDQVRELIPGQGTAEIRIGTSEKEVLELLGQNFATRSEGFKQEQENWQRFGYDTGKILLFNLGFDHFYTYSARTNKTGFPLWKAYFSKGKLQYLIFSSFIYQDMGMIPVGIKPSLFFGESEAKIRESLGEDFYQYKDNKENVHYFYLTKGVTILMKEGEVRAIHIYRPLGESAKNAFLAKLK